MYSDSEFDEKSNRFWLRAVAIQLEKIANFLEKTEEIPGPISPVLETREPEITAKQESAEVEFVAYLNRTTVPFRD